MTKVRRVSEYRVLVGFAVVHSLALLGLLAVIPGGWWKERAWVGGATLWFLWPVALAFHPGRSARRLALSFTLLVVLMLPSFRIYNFEAPSVFGMPEGLSMNPLAASHWTRAYLAGRAEAKNDLRNHQLVIEESGFGAGSGHRFEIFRDRYGVDLRATAQCLVNEQILGHAAGYNSISQPEIARRYGPNVVQAVTDEGVRLDREATARRENYAKELARAISSIPSDSKVTLASVQLWINQRPAEAASDLQEMEAVTQVAHWVESRLVAAVPDDAPAFESHISAALSPGAPPKLEISSSASAPRPVHMQVYEQLPTVPDVRSASDSVSIGMDFLIGESRKAGAR